MGFAAIAACLLRLGRTASPTDEAAIAFEAPPGLATALAAATGVEGPTRWTVSGWGGSSTTATCSVGGDSGGGAAGSCGKEATRRSKKASAGDREIRGRADVRDCRGESGHAGKETEVGAA